MKNQKLEIIKETKLLGLIITSDLRWDKNVDYLVKDANKRMLMLHAASKFTNDKHVLKQIYFSRIRCKLDQSSVVWNSSLTQKNVRDLERVQKAAVRIICGKNYESYSGTLSELGMVTLAERRAKLCLKFAKKSLKIENFGHLFPKNNKRHDMKTRKSDFIKICNSYGQRYYKSAIPSMQRMLNRDIKDQKESLKKLTKVSVTNKLCL